jgi:hypothetical protein
MAYRSYSDEDLIREVPKSTSYRQLLIKFNLKYCGGNYCHMQKKISKLGLDTSHFLGQGWKKGKTDFTKKPVTYYLRIYQNSVAPHSHKLKLKLIWSGLKNAECEQCKHTEWNNKPILLELHHIDGNRQNNLLENLQVLCPNCHSQTDNYRSKNSSRP